MTGVEELLVKGRDHAVLGGLLSQFPALSWLKICFLSPPGEQQPCAGAGCAVLPAWNKSCLRLVGTWWDLLGGHGTGTGG